jgi:hypothetical protein
VEQVSIPLVAFGTFLLVISLPFIPLSWRALRSEGSDGREIGYLLRAVVGSVAGAASVVIGALS